LFESMEKSNDIRSVQPKNPQISTQEESETIDDYRIQKVLYPIIFIGKGTCSIIAGVNDVITAINEYLIDHSIQAHIIEVGCIGLCSAEPLVDIQLPAKSRISFRNISAEKVPLLFDGVLNNIIPEELVLGQYRGINAESWDGVPFIDDIPFFKLQHRVVLEHCGIIDPMNIDDYVAHKGYQAFTKVIRTYIQAEVCQIVENSFLRSREGFGHLTGKKWTSTHNAPGEQKYLICNADESDPGAFLDRAFLESDPHRLIEGIAIGAYAVGASKAYIYIRSDYTLACERLEHAIQKAYEYGFLGYNIFESGFNLDIYLKKSAGAFVCGEETALINSLEGKRGVPRPRPPYPEVRGLLAKPTIIDNLETFATIRSIFEKGPEWYNSIGTMNSKGTKIFTISGKITNVGLVEIPMGTSIRQLIFNIGGGIPNEKKIKAVQIGGPTGTCISEQDLDRTIDFETLKELNVFLGSGGMIVMDENSCMVDVVKYFLEFIAGESCGKCIPCREGTRRMLEILEKISHRPGMENGYSTLDRFKGVMELETLAEVIKDTSLCWLGQTAPNPVLSTLKVFREEYEEHIFDRKCRANICQELRTYFIDVEKCTGCGSCAKKCPFNAIIGVSKNPFFIVESKCKGCGICFQTCMFSAVTLR
jgi:NADH:ubiquinone oxidoreductase subunit F (NADH-binding)/Pyruvate/2-oxoacid:ferredoxin oxidoreductase delta subunit